MQLTSNLRIRRQFSHDNPQARAFTHSRPCPVLGCSRGFNNNSGLTQHLNQTHPGYEEPSSDQYDSVHPPIAEHLDHLSSGSEGSNTSGHRRATVEDVEDEDDVRSSSSGNSEEKTRKHYHSELNGMLQIPLMMFID